MHICHDETIPRGFRRCYDATTLSRKNRSDRFVQLFRRFHAWILRGLWPRKSVIAADATGYGPTKSVWRGTDYGLRAVGPWMKSHAAVEVPSLLYLNTVPTASRVHDSQAFAEVWAGLPENVEPTRSLADSAYANQACIGAARMRGATPWHKPRNNAKSRRNPGNDVQKITRFQHQFPHRFQAIMGRRSLAETAFSCTKNRFGDRIASRTENGQINEIQAKQLGHNIRIIITREAITASRV